MKAHRNLSSDLSSDEDDTSRLVRQLSRINRPLGVTFPQMIKLMGQCQQVTSRLRDQVLTNCTTFYISGLRITIGPSNRIKKHFNFYVFANMVYKIRIKNTGILLFCL